ncbi:glycosyltransferase family 61 protein [Rhodoplanes sp. Z2-YC6860]|uniref:glycosyltransferase family 61 protein n=1 Tax=Rhodoplanes sp. Z2-YC6860 TaxID=674703 RepID=UPI00078BC0D2|nr:glycosyltransferase family 61 protein [Rhodoplanes sp. Z2-YC6860]AMN44602.1 capsular polysaccharide biosynthesis protein-like protein [Rhodoplanes sp. Z2-YC6860]
MIFDAFDPAQIQSSNSFLSCNPAYLYEDGGYYDRETPLSNLQDVYSRLGGSIKVVAQLSSAHEACRPMPAHIAGPDKKFIEKTISHYQQLNENRRRLAPSMLVEINNAVIWNNCLFVVCGGELLRLYEMHREHDRAEMASDHLGAALAAVRNSVVIHPDSNVLFSGSIGSFSYGHWLVDDFCRLAAIPHLTTSIAPMSVVMSETGAHIDAIRKEGVLAAGHGRTLGEILFVDKNEAHFFPRLFYVTPATYHPFLKHPQSLRASAEICHRAFAPGASHRNSKRLFINRDVAYRRQLINAVEVKALLHAHGYQELFPETMTLREQWEAFSFATHVIGIMGAAMTNTLFSGPGKKLLYLAPDGWIESFYWNLAAMLGQPYSVIYGEPIGESQHHHMSSFRVDLALLSDWLDATH